MTNQLHTAEEMLERLSNIELNIFDIPAKTEELKGKSNWIFTLTMPLSALVLVTFTLLGLFIADSFVISFIISALIVFFIAKIIDGYEQQYRKQARQDVMKTIGDIEGEQGLLHHFKDFLPVKFRHLWQSTRKKNFIYVEQYKISIQLLQEKLEHDKFIKLWQLKYPETTPEHNKEYSKKENNQTN